MNIKPLISVIMPTYNSETTIAMSLESVRKQSFSQDLIEILVVDGGSADTTREIAERYGCRVLDNPKTLPEFAKHIGLLNARGKYAVFLDSDEVLASAESLKGKVWILENHQEVKNILTAGLKSPENASFISDYASRFGEPFSFFMYRIDGGDYVKSFAGRYETLVDEDNFVIYKFGEKSVLPIVDSGGHFFDLDFLKEIGKIDSPGIVPMIFTRMAGKTNALAILKNDYTIHHSPVTLKAFRQKIKWRVIGNMHYQDEGAVGFANREAQQPAAFRLRKYLFLLYAFSLFVPLLVSVYLSISERKIGFLLNFPLTLYTALLITYQYFLKLIGIKPRLEVYGDKNEKSRDS